MMVVKKYSNRRLYDTEDSRYITLDELAEKIRKGADVRVVDAASDEDLTQATLAQIILESRGAGRLLPVPLLTQLIRMGDDALAEFFGRYVSWALETYVQARQGAQQLAAMNPFAPYPFMGGMGGNPFGSFFRSEPPPAPPAPSPPPTAAPREDVADLRRELDELRAELRKKRK
jgi:polyhydroxyalkanoate synthesis repressor PhaR